MSSSSHTDAPPVADLPPLAVPPMGEALRQAISEVKPVRMRRPLREFALFVGLSLPFILLATLLTGLRRDLGSLSPLWLASVALVWFSGFALCAYLGFVPAKGQVSPRSRSIYHALGASLVLLISVGLFATQSVDGSSVHYDPSFQKVVNHAGACSLMGFGTGILPGILALLLMKRFVPVGRGSIGLSLGAAGGCLGGLALLFHCPISERFHVGLVHGGAILTAAIFVAGAGRLLLRDK